MGCGIFLYESEIIVGCIYKFCDCYDSVWGLVVKMDVLKDLEMKIE